MARLASTAQGRARSRSRQIPCLVPSVGIFGRLVGAGIGAAVASAGVPRLSRADSTSPALNANNHRGEQRDARAWPSLGGWRSVRCGGYTELGGSQRIAAALAIAGSGAFGAYDDLLGDTDTKGLRGHLTAAPKASITSGFIKLVGNWCNWCRSRSNRASGPRRGHGRSVLPGR